ncbi:MAG: hypothetical protein R3B09_25410 [Nannocystaceae bacterium]
MSRSALRLAAPALALCGGLALPDVAAAAVSGSQGIEIEGPRDRRGFYIGPGLSMGAQFFSNAVIPAGRLELALGGGVTKRFTLGVNLQLGVYMASSQPRKVFFGGDVEGTGFLIKGFFLRGAIGGAGVPKGDGTTDLAIGGGGAVGIGYEFWLNMSAAMQVAATYDLRYVPEVGLRQGGFLGVRFTWY